MTDRVEYVNDIHGQPGFRVTIKDPGEYRDVVFTATIDVVTAWTGASPGALDVAEHEPYLTCTIKWDSCAHLNFGSSGDSPAAGRDGYLHFCGVEDFKNHALLLEALYRMAFTEMGREPEDRERW